MKSFCFKTLHEQQKFNHIPGTFQIGRKDGLWKSLNNLIVKFGQDNFDFLPTTYLLPQETKGLRQLWDNNNEELWIIKPVLPMLIDLLTYPVLMHKPSLPYDKYEYN